jgi:NitT/TauT family transport system substrate-binding protein
MIKPTPMGVIGTTCLGLILLLSGWLAQQSYDESNQPADMTIAVSAWPTSRLVHAAKYLDYFDRSDLNLKIVDYGQNYTQALTAIQSGQVNAGIFELNDALRLAAAGTPLKIIMATDFSKTGFSIVATAEVASLGDLKDKKIVISAGSAEATAVTAALRRANLNSTDVSLEIAEQTPALDRFLSGQAEAFVGQGPILFQAGQFQGSHIIYAEPDPFSLSATVLAVRTDYALQHSGEIANFVAGWFDMINDLASAERVRGEIISILAIKQGATSRETEKQLSQFKLLTLEENVAAYSADHNTLTLKDLANNHLNILSDQKFSDGLVNLDAILDKTFVVELGQ